jgi:hypothetical protein
MISVAAGVADVMFHPLLLTSHVVDVNATRRYYAVWLLQRRTNLCPLLQLNGSVWLLCLFVVVLGK